MTRRHAFGLRRSVATCALAVASALAIAPATVRADDPPAEESAPEPPAEDAGDTGEVDGAEVAVGLPPVPPASPEPEVAVGLPPVPPASPEPEVAVGLPPVPPESPEVAVGQPPVPPVSDAPAVAVGKPPVPSAAKLAAGARGGTTVTPRVLVAPSGLTETVDVLAALIGDVL